MNQKIKNHLERLFYEIIEASLAVCAVYFSEMSWEYAPFFALLFRFLGKKFVKYLKNEK